MNAIVDSFMSVEDEYESDPAINSTIAQLDAPVAPGNLTYASQPLDSTQLFYGIATGVGVAFVPGLREAENGTDALAVLSECFDVRRMFATQKVTDMYGGQDGKLNITEDEARAFGEAVSPPKNESDTIISKMTGFFKQKGAASKAFAKFGALLKKMTPFLLKTLAKFQRCGTLDAILGFLFGIVIGLFPPLLFIVMPIAVISMGIEIYKQIRAMIDNYGRDWFLFGKAIGILLGYLGIIFISYKMGQRKQRMQCNGKAGCSYDVPAECGAKRFGCLRRGYTGKAKHCPAGNTCNQVLKNDRLIDPSRVDSLGRTNRMRMNAGKAPIGADGKPVRLLHVDPKQTSRVAEMSHTYQNGDKGVLSVFRGNKNADIDTKLFDDWAASYWRTRAKDFSTTRSGWGIIHQAPTATQAILHSVEVGDDPYPEDPMGVAGHWQESNFGKIGVRIIEAFRDGTSDEELASGAEVGAASEKGLGYFDMLRWILTGVKGRVESATREHQPSICMAADGLSSGLCMRTCEANVTRLPANASSGCEELPDEYACCVVSAEERRRRLVASPAECALDPKCPAAVRLDAAAYAKVELRVLQAASARRVELVASPALLAEGMAAVATVRAYEGVFHVAESHTSLKHELLDASTKTVSLALHACDAAATGDDAPTPTLAFDVRSARPASDMAFDADDVSPEWADFWAAHNTKQPGFGASMGAVQTSYVRVPRLADAAAPVRVERTEDALSLAFKPAYSALVSTAESPSAVVYEVYAVDADTAQAAPTVCTARRSGVRVDNGRFR